MTRPPLSSLHLMSSDPDWTLLGRYLDGDCSPGEAEAITRWAVGDAENAQLLEFLRQVWAEAGVPRPDEEAGWRTMREKMAAAHPTSGLGDVVPARLGSEPSGRSTARSPWSGRRIPVALAAAAATVLLVGAPLLRRQHAADRRDARVAFTGREYATSRGQRAQVTLVDGTRVWLNVDSRLRLSPDYGRTTRDVALEGEAYFAVRHDPRRPFRVHARDAVSEDLGTEFDVRAYVEDPEVVVAVASGRVAMGRDAGGKEARADAGVELARGQMGRLGRTGRVRVTDGVDLANQFGWREDRLEFVGRPLDEILRALERWYDLEIVLDDASLRRVPVTLSIRQHTADQALRIVAGIVDVGYTRDGRRVWLSSKIARR